MILLTKDPGDRLPYGADYSPWLATGETITDSTWDTSPSGELVLQESLVLDGSGTSVWISEGVDGETYTVVNTVTTDSSPVTKVKVYSFILQVRRPVP